MTGRQKLISIVGLCLIAFIVLSGKFVREAPAEESLSQILYALGESQQNKADDITNAAVSKAEGTVVGEHLPDGANWSIPNIVRHLLGLR